MPPIPRDRALGYRHGVQIPEAVHKTVRRRMGLLDRAQRAVIMRASVIGRRFDLSILIAAAPYAEATLQSALDRACRLHLLVADESVSGRFAFRHALIRDAVYAEFVGSATRPLHRRIARALERSLVAGAATLEDLAYHAWAGGDARRAVRYNELAGDNAAAVHAQSDARTYYGRARSLLDVDSPAYARLSEKFAAMAED